MIAPQIFKGKGTWSRRRPRLNTAHMPGIASQAGPDAMLSCNYLRCGMNTTFLIIYDLQSTFIKSARSHDADTVFLQFGTEDRINFLNGLVVYCFGLVSTLPEEIGTGSGRPRYRSG